MTVEIGTSFQEPFHLNKKQQTGDSSEEEEEEEEESLESVNDPEEENTENVSPIIQTGLELMVAVRPTTQHNQLLNSKINISTPNKNTIEHSILIARNIVSPIKRPFISGLPSEAPVSKKAPSATDIISSPLLGSPNQRQLSQSAGNSSKLQSAIRRAQTNLSQSCFADLCSNRGDDIDSDLTCLSWLQEGNLLNALTSEKKSEEEGVAKGDEKEIEIDIKSSNEHSDLRLNLSDPLNAISEVEKTLRKPAYSFSTLIFMAIENAKDKRLPVKEIYQWIQDNFPYFQKAPIGWKNSVRHNLSLNKSFKKVDKEKCVGKGSLWTIDHEARAGLVQQLRKTSTYHSYPYSRLPYPNRYYSKERILCKRDSTGRFVPNHDDAEFDVAATMCSLSSPAALYRSPSGSSKSSPEEQKSSVELLRIWRTYIEPREDDEDNEDTSHDSNLRLSSLHKESITKCSKPRYTIGHFLEEVHNKLSFKVKRNISTKVHRGGSLNTSLDEDYEFYNSEDDSSDEDDEMSQNMRKLVEKERDDGLGDSGYSEEGTLKTSTMLDHSYSKSIQSLCKPQSRRESKGVAALLSLANAASKELESLCKEDPSDQPSRNARTKCNSNAIKKQMNLIKSKSSSLEGVVST